MDADLRGKTAVVTGATSGVGKETARGLARMGAHVVLAVRDAERGRAVAEELARDAAPGARLEVMRLDLASLASVRRFAEEYRARHARLDVLVNNAGVHVGERVVTEDGHELTWQTNHLGHFVLTDALLDVLRASAPARVVNVASEAHRYGWMRWDDLEMTRWSGWLAYAQSKLANILFSNALARRLEGTGVTSNALHPGSVRTGWGRGEESGAFRYLVKAATPLLMSPERGARTSLKLAADPRLAGVSGRYFARGVAVPPSGTARSVDAQERLWRESERMAALTRPGRSAA